MLITASKDKRGNHTNDHERIDINPDYGKVHAAKPGERPYLVTYVQPESEELIRSHKRPAVIICPGGAYRMKSDREAEVVALRYLAAGFHAFVLQYSVAPSRYPCALLELAESVALVRSRAGEWNIDPERIFVLGFPREDTWPDVWEPCGTGAA